MASKLMKSNILRSLPARRFAAQAATKSSDYGVLPREPLKTTTLPNGVVVASIENQSPLSRVAIAVRGGSRYETPDNRGATHLLRIVAGLTNAENTAFGLTRELQQLGASLACSADREVLIYSADATRNHMDVVMELLANAATRQVFKPWEITDIKPHLKLDVETTPAEVSLIEDLHLAAFRQSDLGNSVVAPHHLIGQLGPDQLASHLSRTLLAGRTAVCGTGIDHETLVEYAQGLQLPQGEGPAPAARYGGGELRTEIGGGVALVAVAAEGAGRSSATAAQQAVLQAVLGAGAVVKYGAGRGVLGAAAAQAGGAAAALNAVYSDTGLVGYTVAAEADKAGQVIEAVNKAFKTTSLTAEDVNRGKALAKAAVLRADDNSGSCVETMGVQGASLGKVSAVSDALAAIDAVKLSDVQTLHKRLVGGKLSMAARGNLRTVPYLDQL
ncbi:Cytochrome b-c1 complex subunit 2, mitochondrial [Amphibalanus amphitrite]|uniref:Cytochrome b-c1 complex subunit 2, mitochondrial n=1 Tax=Amphibalanus amphitrite TaxID=1232801 RepID=A0A6A4WF51_AMPAM|nr:cytochrome b-c1 complex subunit 2, mitochondrial-like [Amphibalanus amphitrite]KAF0305355.1 Cytochrome b-c1 complex subunit 2, mitochondrial [Amphibalanus amphitrite]